MKISYQDCLGLSSTILAQFSLKMCVAVQNREKFTKTPYFGDSRPFKVIDLDIPKKLVTSAYYDNQHVCAYLQPFSWQTSHYRQNNVFFSVGAPLSPPRS